MYLHGRNPQTGGRRERMTSFSKNGGLLMPNARSNRGKIESTGSRYQGTRLHDRTPVKMVKAEGEEIIGGP